METRGWDDEHGGHGAISVNPSQMVGIIALPFPIPKNDPTGCEPQLFVSALALLPLSFLFFLTLPHTHVPYG